MHYSYTPTGVHSKSIEFDIEDNIVKNVQIIGGCDGNNKGMAALAEGNIDIEYMYSLFTHIDGKAYIVFRVAETEKFVTLLGIHGITPCTGDALGIH